MRRTADLFWNVVHRVRRRGCALLFLALLDFVYGTPMLFNSPSLREIPLYTWAKTVAPLEFWGAAWIVVGALCLVYAFQAEDRVAFTAATLVKVSWAGVCVFGWLLANVPRGQVSAALWIALAAFVLVVATWPESYDLPPVKGASAAAVISANAAGAITAWNSGAALMFGWRAEEIVGKPLTLLIPDSLAGRHRSGFERAVREGVSPLAGRVLRMNARHRDGRTFPVELTISIWGTGGEVSFTGVVRGASPAPAPAGGEG